ncbi:MAG TPA: hypothetical protein VG388_02955 [Solirubrobacteraceae bacterium]|nr:hypothetical protein [Solirubrobacteraceae bacterium]
MTSDELGERVLVARAGTRDQFVFGNRWAGKQAPTLYRTWRGRLPPRSAGQGGIGRFWPGLPAR